MEVKRFVNSIFNSNSYLLTKKDATQVWVIDPGDAQQLLNAIGTRSIKGILLTHTHFDHIYGVNELISKFPQVEIYTSEWGIEGLKCDKLNGSRYMEFPFVVSHPDELVKVVKDGDFIQLWDDTQVDVWSTTGHNRDCLSYYSKEGFVFTGDALINGIKVVAKSKYSNKDDVLVSLQKIIDRTFPDDILCPGHNERCAMKNCKFADLNP